MKTNLGGKIAVCLVHHDDDVRTSQARKVAEYVAAVLRDAGGVVPSIDNKVIESKHQPLKYDEKAVRFSILQYYFVKAFQYSHVSRNSNSGKIKRFLLLLTHLSSKSFWSTTDLSRTRIERLLMMKHLYLWSLLANGDLDGAVVLEDDCRMGEPIVVKKGLLTALKGNHLNYDFIDLAGGYTFKELSMSADDSGIFRCQGIRSNTTCGYYLSKSLAKRFVEMSQYNPFLLYLGVGFFINQVNDYFPQSGMRSLHFKNPPLIHGSFSSLVPSSISSRH